MIDPSDGPGRKTGARGDARDVPGAYPLRRVPQEIEERRPSRISDLVLLGMLAYVGVSADRSGVLVSAAICATTLLAFPAAKWIRAAHAARTRARVRAVRPHEPWTWDRAWSRCPRVSGADERSAAIRAIACGVFTLLLMTAAFVWFIPTYTVVAWLLLAPAALVIWILWYGWRALRRSSVFVGFARIPYFIADRVDLTIGAGEAGPAFHEATFYLRCVEEVPGATPRWWCTWSDAKQGDDGLAPAPDADVVVSFDLPADAEGTVLHGTPRRFWELVIVGTTGAGKVWERFLVPIYARPAGVAA